MSFSFVPQNLLQMIVILTVKQIYRFYTSIDLKKGATIDESICNGYIDAEPITVRVDNRKNDKEVQGDATR